MAEPHNLQIAAVGRFVSGSITEKRDKDHENRPIPEDKQQYQFGVAFRKDDPDMQRVFGEVYQYAAACWAQQPQKLTALQNWYSTLSGLSMKISDGDAPNRQGKVNENTAGHFVFWFSSAYPVKTCDPAYQEIAPESIKRGYFVQIVGNINDNDQAIDRAGIYMNASHVMLVGEGDVIQGGVDAATAFAGIATPQQLPPGAKPLGANVGMPGTTPPGAPGNVPGQPASMPGTTAPGQPPQASVPTQPPAPPQQTTPALPGATSSPSNVPPQPPAAPGQPNAMPQPHTGITQGPPPGMPGQS